MVYYVKQGQISAFRKIKIVMNQCEISSKSLNYKNGNLEKIVKKISKKKVEQVVLSKEIKENQKFIKILNNYDITIFDGKWLMQYIIPEIIDVLKEKGKISEIDEITVLTNDLTNEVKYNIKEFASTYKKIRIVTNHLEKFKRIEQELFEENGISVIITNNKRKALSKSTLIVNFDFVQEIVNQYNINENAIILNLNEKIKINKKRFCGTIITDYEVKLEEFDEENKLENLNFEDIVEKGKEFSMKDILEEKIYTTILKKPNCNAFQEINRIIKKCGIEIKEIYGINGKIA